MMHEKGQRWSALRRLAESIDWTKLPKMRVKVKMRPTAITNKKRKRERALRQSGMDWKNQNHWQRVADHAPEWDGQGRLVQTQKVFHLRK